MCGFFKRNCLGLQKFFPLTQSLLEPEVVGTYLPGTGTLGWGAWCRAGGPGVGLGLLAPEISLPNFYPPHVDETPACSEFVPLLPVWVDMVSLIL